jgi:chemotaxis signal transduction protein
MRGRFNPTRTEIKTDNSVLLFWVGPYRMGIPAAALKEIRNSRRLFSNGNPDHPEESSGCDAILSAGTFFGVRTGAEDRLLVLRSRNVGVRVDKVERMVEVGKLHPLPQAFQGEERSWYGGITLVGEAIVPLLNPETLAHEALSQAAESRSNEERNGAMKVEVAS